ncbi:hypothetical protein PRIO_2241 [Paenibacillus riograndensis SBR5]|uniref:Secreted protein n=1 Tax=Paenibacillus riograndensis SBR5 TaxID=1073571 RepID=A0A0E4HA07_9BACL|nr:hypothetical protein PRIO_2241 [Paenibacillus riograndensis SBR5]
MAILHNFPLISALCAIVAAQFIKVPIYLITLLGHRPSEVFVGALFGIFVSFVLHYTAILS